MPALEGTGGVYWTNKRTGLVFLVESWSLARSISQTFAAGSFKTWNTIPINLRDEIEIKAEKPDGTLMKLLTGIVTDLSADDSNLITYELKSKSAIMAESEAEPWDWSNSMGADVIESICGEFEVDVGIDPAILGSDVPLELVIDPGQTALSVIVNICQQRGWIIEDVDDNSLWITQVGSEAYTVGLVRGIPPFISGSLSASDQRVATVTAERTLPAPKRLGKTKIEDVVIYGKAVDSGARIGTKQYVRSTTAATTNELDYLAAAKSLAKGAGGIRYTATVQGLFCMDGSIWAINKLLVVSDPLRRVLAWTGLVDTVEMSGGATTSMKTILTLVAPAVYLGEDMDTATGAALTDPFKGLTVF